MINKIKFYIQKYFKKAKIQRAEQVYAKVAKKPVERHICPRCISCGGNNGYFEKWKSFKSFLTSFFKRRKSPYGVCFVCRGGGYVWKINHIASKNETLKDIALKYDIVFDGGYKTNQPKLFEFKKWNVHIASEDHQVNENENIKVYVDFFVWEAFLISSAKCRFKNGYQVYYDKISKKWKWMHRFLVEKALGEEIPRGYEVHHIDHDKKNNNPLNLVPIPKTIHREYHLDEKSGKVKKNTILDYVKSLLSGINQ